MGSYVPKWINRHPASNGSNVSDTPGHIQKFTHSLDSNVSNVSDPPPHIGKFTPATSGSVFTPKYLTNQIDRKKGTYKIYATREDEKYLDMGGGLTDITATIRRPLVYDGREVARVIWSTDNALVFQDPEGRYWRYLESYKQAWPVIVEGENEQPTPTPKTKYTR